MISNDTVLTVLNGVNMMEIRRVIIETYIEEQYELVEALRSEIERLKNSESARFGFSSPPRPPALADEELEAEWDRDRVRAAKERLEKRLDKERLKRPGAAK